MPIIINARAERMRKCFNQDNAEQITKTVAESLPQDSLWSTVATEWIGALSETLTYLRDSSKLELSPNVFTERFLNQKDLADLAYNTYKDDGLFVEKSEKLRQVLARLPSFKAYAAGETEDLSVQDKNQFIFITGHIKEAVSNNMKLRLG